MSAGDTRPGCYRGETGEECPSIPGVLVKGNGNSTSTSFSWPKITSNKDLLLGIMLGLAIIEGALLFYAWRQKAQQSELQRYELADFQTHQFNPLVAQVKSDHDLIQAYGLTKAVADNCKR